MAFFSVKERQVWLDWPNGAKIGRGAYFLCEANEIAFDLGPR
ncbi:hypothetical protein [Rhodovulum sp. BSW8]|nr:hypothetical protein [Rhodovulum sp. BSW8]